LLDGNFYAQKEKRNTERCVWSVGTSSVVASPIDVAETWVKEIDGTIHQLVIKQLEAFWEFVEKGSTWDGAIGVLEHDLPEGSTWKKQ
jgi:hypothetical protein